MRCTPASARGRVATKVVGGAYNSSSAAPPYALPATAASVLLVQHLDGYAA
jgi:hypothetical protein